MPEELVYHMRPTEWQTLCEELEPALAPIAALKVRARCWMQAFIISFLASSGTAFLLEKGWIALPDIEMGGMNVTSWLLLAMSLWVIFLLVVTMRVWCVSQKAIAEHDAAACEILEQHHLQHPDMSFNMVEETIMKEYKLPRAVDALGKFVAKVKGVKGANIGAAEVETNIYFLKIRAFGVGAHAHGAPREGSVAAPANVATTDVARPVSVVALANV